MGYVAAALVFAAFYMRTMMLLRIMAIASNIAFLAYGIPLHLWPVAILHGLLLPLNTVRLVQLRRLLAQLRSNRTAPVDMTKLLPHLQPERHPAGTTLFRQGDRATYAYYITEGEVVVPELGIHLLAGQLFGEVGVFAEGLTRLVQP